MKTTPTSSLATLLQPHLEALRTRQTTNKAVAERLGYTPEHVSRVLKELGIVKVPHPKSERARNHDLFEARKQLRRELAMSPALSPKQAARQAKCSLRTIYRYKTP